MRTTITAAILAAMPLAACSDPKAANEANFRKAIEPLVRDRFCRSIDDVDRMQVGNADEVTAWPLIVPVVPFQSHEPGGKAARALLEEAAREGLLDRRTETIVGRRVGYTEQPASREVIVYTPTDKGEVVFRPIERKAMSGMRTVPGACAAKAEVTEIVRWTDPADAFGATVSQVTYRYRGTDVGPVVPADQRTGFEEPKEATVTLVRSSDGWQPVGR